MPVQCDVRCIRNVVRKEMTQKSIAHLVFLFPGRSLSSLTKDFANIQSIISTGMCSNEGSIPYVCVASRKVQRAMQKCMTHCTFLLVTSTYSIGRINSNNYLLIIQYMCPSLVFILFCEFTNNLIFSN
jgi:hypothetical protein